MSARSLNMPGALGGAFGRGGTKIINASLANGRRGLPRAHVALIVRYLLDVRTMRCFDLDADVAARFAGEIHDGDTQFSCVVLTAEAGVHDCDLVIAMMMMMMTTTGYIPFAWLKPGSLFVHVSLDDALHGVLERADLLFVDDWGLCTADEYRLVGRLVGRLVREGELVGPRDVSSPHGARRVDGSWGWCSAVNVPVGAHPTRSSS